MGVSGLIESGGTESASVNNGGWVPLASFNRLAGTETASVNNGGWVPLASFNRVAGTETASVNNGGWVPLASLNRVVGTETGPVCVCQHCRPESGDGSPDSTNSQPRRAG